MKLSAVLAGFVLAVSTTFAFAHVIQYAAQLDGPSESPSNASAGFGNALVTIDLDLATMRVDVSFAGLDGNVTASHIHCCTTVPGVSTAGVATVFPSFPGFPGGTSGTYDKLFDLAATTPTDTYNQAFITASGGTESDAMNALLLGLGAGKAYLNIHTSSFGGGEIRGFLQAVPVPEPETYALFLAGLGLLALAARRRTSA